MKNPHNFFLGLADFALSESEVLHKVCEFMWNGKEKKEYIWRGKLKYYDAAEIHLNWTSYDDHWTRLSSRLRNSDGWISSYRWLIHSLNCATRLFFLSFTSDLFSDPRYVCYFVIWCAQTHSIEHSRVASIWSLLERAQSKQKAPENRTKQAQRRRKVRREVVFCFSRPRK